MMILKKTKTWIMSYIYVTFMVFLVVTVHILLLNFIDCLYILSFYMWLRIVLNSKQRQRKDTDGLHWKLHLLTLNCRITHTTDVTQETNSERTTLRIILEKNPATIKITILKYIYITHFSVLFTAYQCSLSSFTYSFIYFNTKCK